MRLGVFIPILDDKPHGVGVYIEEVCSRLIRLHSDVVVYTGTPEAKRPWLEGVEIRSLGDQLLPGVSFAKGPRRRARRLLWLMGQAKRQLVRDRIDVLFSPVQEGPVAGDVPSCVVMHDLTALKYPEAYHALDVAQTRWMLPHMLRHARQVVAVSENTRRDVMQAFRLSGERVTVVGEGFDGEVFRPHGDAEHAAARRRHGLHGRYLLYAGTFSRHKNLKVVLDALPLLNDRARDVTFAVSGRMDAGRAAEFEAHVRERGLERRVKLLGYLTRTDLAALMSDAAAFVYPSRYEGFGLAPLEAMACGAPVVASNVASLPEVVGPGGTLVSGETPSAWAQAIDGVLALDRAEVQERALLQAARFRWDDAARSLADLLGNMCRSR